MRKDITDDEEQLEYIGQWLLKKQMKKIARAVKKEERRLRRARFKISNRNKIQ